MTTLDNRQPTLALNQTVALSGIFPSSAGNLLPLGAIRTYAFTAQGNPNADTNGQLLPVSQNSALFSLLGTTYGGDGIKSFALPDLRNRAVVDEGNGRPEGSTAGSVTETIVFSDLQSLGPLPPVATDDTASTSQNDAVALTSLLANDTDLNGDSLSIVSVDGSAGQAPPRHVRLGACEGLSRSDPACLKQTLSPPANYGKPQLGERQGNSLC